MNFYNIILLADIVPSLPDHYASCPSPYETFSIVFALYPRASSHSLLMLNDLRSMTPAKHYLARPNDTCVILLRGERISLLPSAATHHKNDFPTIRKNIQNGQTILADKLHAYNIYVRVFFFGQFFVGSRC